jgi:hypothetical protein
MTIHGGHFNFIRGRYTRHTNSDRLSLPSGVLSTPLMDSPSTLGSAPNHRQQNCAMVSNPRQLTNSVRSCILILRIPQGTQTAPGIARSLTTREIPGPYVTRSSPSVFFCSQSIHFRCETLLFGVMISITDTCWRKAAGYRCDSLSLAVPFQSNIDDKASLLVT